MAGYSVSLTSPTSPSGLANPQLFTVSEAYGPATTCDTGAGDYAQLPAGFAVQLTLTPTGTGSAQNIVVIALRGTRTWQEWIDDALAVPVSFPGTILSLGTVHAGIFGLYTIGTDGSVSTKPLSDRATGSIAAQVAAYVGQLSGLPIYVTGHSLAGALASLCGLDIAYYFASNFSELFVYSLASPRLAVGIAGIPFFDDQESFVKSYQQYVPNTYQIVHSADIVPILPSLTAPLGPLTLQCAQVTDPWGGVGATATATLNESGGVASVSVINTASSGYSSSLPPNVVFSGGGGSGAVAQASVSGDNDVSVEVTDSGSGYTSPPSVQILPAGSSLLSNVINFCAQTGDVGCNHSCLSTYVPYLAQLAASFEGS